MSESPSPTSPDPLTQTQLAEPPAPPPEAPSSAVDAPVPWLHRWWPGVLIATLTLLFYLPALQNGFIWDDDQYVIENTTLRSLSGLGRIWFDVKATPQYYPLVHTTFWIEHQIYGLWPAGFHFVNIALHAATAVLVWRVLRMLGIPHLAAWAAGAIFAVHPVHVESVAWITERKNVLMALLYVASLAAYIRFDPSAFGLRRDEMGGDVEKNPGLRPAAGELRPGLTGVSDGATRDWNWFGVALACFVGAMLSKTVAASLPAAILVIQWWKRGRFNWRDVQPLLPFVLIGVPLGLFTAHHERTHVGAVGIDWTLSMTERCLIAGRALWFYAGKLAFPRDLTFIYPRWEVDASSPGWWAWPITAVALVVVLWVFRKRIGRGPLAAVLFFGGTLLPALGFFDIYPMRYSFVADHFQYVASLGLIVLVCGAVGALGAVVPPGSWRIGAVLAGVAVLGLGVHTFLQTLAYENHETLWRDTLAKNERAWIAHNNLGIILAKRNEVEEAYEHMSRGVELHGNVVETRGSLADLLVTIGRPEQAIEQFQAALQLIKPLDGRRGSLHNKLGEAYALAGQTDAAKVEHQKAAEFYAMLVPDNRHSAMLHYEMGMALSGLGDSGEAVNWFAAASRLDPAYPDLDDRWGRALLRLGRTDEALQRFSMGLRRDRRQAEIWRNVAWVLATHPDPAVRNGIEAVKCATEAVKLTGERGPRHLDALAAAQAEAGQMKEAAANAQTALELAERANMTTLAKSIAGRLELYRQGKPYHQPQRLLASATQAATQPGTQPGTQPATQAATQATTQSAAGETTMAADVATQPADEPALGVEPTPASQPSN